VRDALAAELVLEQDQADEPDLERGRGLAPQRRPEAPPQVVQREREAGEQDDEVAADDQDDEPQRDPRRRPGVEAQDDERAHQQELVRQRVEDGAERRAQVEVAGDEAVEAVGHAGHHEHRERPPELVVGHAADQHRDQHHAQQREDVGDVHLRPSRRHVSRQ